MLNEVESNLPVFFLIGAGKYIRSSRRADVLFPRQQESPAVQRLLRRLPVRGPSVPEYQPIRLSMLASDRRAMPATRERYMRARRQRARLRQLRHKPSDQAA